MTIKEIIDGLKFTVEMFLFDPMTGETFNESRNDMDKTTIDACRGAIEALEQTKWIPVKFRPLTEEEQEQYPDYCYIADCPMPDDGEEILVSTVYNTVEKDECGVDDGLYLDSGYDWQTDIVAWMPLPEPYKAESEDKK